ncbi:hypothetical protein F442_03272, partial [Phytophthora nicotianae P10297]
MAAAFRAVWSQLLKEGWKSSRPRGLETDYTYLRPGKTKADVRGVDYFVGGEELLKYLDRLALEEVRQKKAKTTTHALPSASSSNNAGAARGEGTSCTAADARADNLANVDLHSGAVPRITGGTTPEQVHPPNEDDADLQNNASEVVQPLQQADAGDPQRNLNAEFAEVVSESGIERTGILCPTSLHIEDSSSSSETEVDDGRRDTNLSDDSPDTDINVTRAGDSSEDYMAFDSDGENDDGFDNNDEDLDFKAPDPYDDDIAAPPDMMFGDDLLAAVGGVDGIT